MISISPDRLKNLNAICGKMDSEFDSFWRADYKEVSEFILPRRYVWLENQNGLVQGKKLEKNRRILDPTATIAARTLASGMMNGLTSPARPWFRLRLTDFPGDDSEYPRAVLAWLEEVGRRLHIILAESNFYHGLAINYLELGVFGTATMLIYEDFRTVIRVYNSPMGEYRISQGHAQSTNRFTRKIWKTVEQIVDEFGLENCGPEIRAKYNVGGAGRLETFPVRHVIERHGNAADIKGLSSSFEWREFYYECGAPTGQLLRLAGFQDDALVASRWEVVGNDTYGTSPSFDSLGDIKQLQLETKNKAQALDKLVRPPIVADVALQAQPTALLPGGTSYVGGNSFGAKPIYTVNPPLGEMTQDMRDLQMRIKETFFNHLFRNVSNLSTVRSATEIVERKAEDMILLGSVLERFETEALNPAIRRVFNIAMRKGLLPEPPGEIPTEALDIQYVSILADAQRAAGTGTMEQFMAVIGQLAGAVPQVLDIPDYDELVRHYARRLNIPASALRSKEEVAQSRQAREEQLQLQEEALVGEQLTNAAKNLSQTEVGGGQNAIEAVLGGISA